MEILSQWAAGFAPALMELQGHLSLGFSVAFTVENLLYALVGCLLGTLIGVLPGIGPVSTIAMLLPAIYGLPLTAALIMVGRRLQCSYTQWTQSASVHARPRTLHTADALGLAIRATVAHTASPRPSGPAGPPRTASPPRTAPRPPGGGRGDRAAHLERLT